MLLYNLFGTTKHILKHPETYMESCSYCHARGKHKTESLDVIRFLVHMYGERDRSDL